MISTLPRSSRQFSRQGFSLIEVAIALVIFVIGALAIIRIFPGALNVINNNGDQQIATNLNRDVLAKMKSEDAVPDATFNLRLYTTGPLNGQIQWTTANTVNHTADYGDSGTAVNGIPRFVDSLPTGDEVTTGQQNSALSRYRAVQDEQTKVVTINDDGGSFNYVLTRFPISVQTVGTTFTPYAPVISKNIELLSVRINPDGRFDFLRATEASAPDQIITPATFFNPRSLLYVTYRYRNAVGFVWGVREEAVILPPDLTTLDPNDVAVNDIRVSPPTTGVGAATANGVVAEIVNVRFKKFLVTGDFAPTFTPVNDFEKVGDARRGLVAVGPSNPVAPSDLNAGDTVSVDYVADWSFLMQKGIPSIAPSEIPAAAPPAGNQYRQIALGTPFIEDRTNVGIYSLLVDPTPTTGSEGYRSSFGESPQTTATVAANKLVPPTEDELRDGRVTFIAPNSASLVRVAYRTRDNWVQQLSVSANSYKPFVPGNVEPWRDYAFGTNSGDNYLYFHAGDAGKSLLASYTYDDGNGNLSSVTDKPLTIAPEVVNASGVVVGGFSMTRVSRLQLLDRDNNVLLRPQTPVPTVPFLVSIQSVRGNSITSRTAYVNGSKYAQTLLTSNRGTN